jgi:small subunit ribosomal protein S6
LTDFVRTYWHDCLYILRANLTAEETAEAVEQFRNIIDERGGGLVKLEEMGRRRFTYEIKREREGYYVDMIFWGGAPVVEELNRVLRIDSRIVRHTIVRETKRQFHRRLQDMAKGESQPAAEEPVTGESEDAAEAPIPELPIESEVEPTAEPIAESVTETVAEPVEETIPEPAEETIPEPVEEIVPETDTETVPETVDEPAGETDAPEGGAEEGS